MPQANPSSSKPDIRLRADLLRYKNLLYDRLTGLPTLPVALNEIRRMLDRDDHAVGLICVELSRTATLESSFGWQSTDELISRLAKVLSVFNDDVMDAEGIVFEEAIRTPSFFLFFTGSGLTTGMITEVAVMVREFYKISTLGKELRENNLDVSIGYSLIVDDPLVRFERVVYSAIREARDMASDEDKREETLKYRELAQIISGERIKTRFQPIVYMKDKAVLGYEALSLGPDNTIFQNAEHLFSYASNSGLSGELDNLCRRHAVSVAPEVIGSEDLLFLNTTPLSFTDPRFFSDLEESDAYKSQRIVLELTERTAIHDLTAFKNSLTRYREKGFLIAVDDAGAGYSSLNTIAELRPEFLKFDRAMVTEIHKNKIKQELLLTLLDLASRIGSRVIAEGIETVEEFEKLKEMGAELAQGYYVSRPTEGF